MAAEAHRGYYLRPFFRNKAIILELLTSRGFDQSLPLFLASTDSKRTTGRHHHAVGGQGFHLFFSTSGMSADA
jgi:hypothetical protein